MSRSQPELQNPAEHFIKWSGSKGTLSWWDKENKREVPVKIPFEFLVLDQLSTITGYSKSDDSGFWSNEVKATRNQPLTVKTKRGIVASGLYADIKDTIKSKGAKFATSVYIAHKDKSGEYIMGNLQVSGAALGPWIDLNAAHKLENGKVRLTGSTEGQNGATVYQIPTFEYTNASDEENTAAIKLDEELQLYLLHYMTASQADYDSHVPEGDSDTVDDLRTPTDEDYATQSRLNAAKRKPVKAEEYPEDDPEFASMLQAGYQADDIDLPPGF